MRYGTSTTLIRGEKASSSLSVNEVISKLNSGGFSNIDYHIPTDFSKVFDRESPMKGNNWRESCEQLRSYASKVGSIFYQTHNIMTNYFETTLQAKENNQIVDRGLDITALLGAEVVVMHPIAPPGLEHNRAECLRMNRQFFTDKAERASRLGIKIAIENMLSNNNFDATLTRRYCTSMDELVELVAAIQHPDVGICVDVGHAHYMGHDIHDSIMQCKDYLLAVHIHDNNRFDDLHLVPYCGTIDWDHCFQGLAESKYDGVFSLEVYHACEKLHPDLQNGFVRAIADLTLWMTSQVSKYEVMQI